MLFNSYEFIFAFLPAVFLLYFLLLRQRWILPAKLFLIAASLFFYAWWNPAYLPLILGSTLFNYIVGGRLARRHTASASAKPLLAFGITANLALLGYFKYADFFIANLNQLGVSNLTLLHLALPLAISFVTFQQIAFLVDSYKGHAKENDFISYALFITFFPQLIAGPIVHHAEMMPQFASRHNWVKNYRNIALGLFIFATGLFKKCVIADTFAHWANAGFDNPAALGMTEAWITSLSYTFQLYFDFSGYSDMAIGLALLFNIRLPLNFNSPYKALSIQDFWRRWHMTLSRFLRDYIYIPLGGNQKGSIRTWHNLMLTFLIGGLWHGAGWTFIFWGFLHGLALIIHRLWQATGLRMPVLLAWFLTFNFVNIAWVFFRAPGWHDATQILKSMFLGDPALTPWLATTLGTLPPLLRIDTSGHNGQAALYTVLFLLAGFILALACKNSQQQAATLKFGYLQSLRIALMVFTALLIGFFGSQIGSEFLYFNF